MQQGIAYVPEQCSRGCVNSCTCWIRLCIIAPASKMPGNITYQSRIKVWTFNCETGNSFWKSWLRKLGQTLRRKRTMKTVQSPLTHLLKKKVEKQIGGVNLKWHDIGNSLWSGIGKAEWLGPHCFMTRCCSGVTMALLRRSWLLKDPEDQKLAWSVWSPLLLVLQHNSQHDMQVGLLSLEATVVQTSQKGFLCLLLLCKSVLLIKVFFN